MCVLLLLDDRKSKPLNNLDENDQKYLDSQSFLITCTDFPAVSSEYNSTKSQMGRPAASETNKALALEFARLVTEKTDNPNDIIARSGSLSMYSALVATCPSIIRRDNTGPRDGISEAEFNKVLQVNLALHSEPKFLLPPPLPRPLSIDTNENERHPQSLPSNI